MKSKLKWVSLMTLCILIFNNLINPFLINEAIAHPVDELSIRKYTYEFNKWVIDENNNYMYVQDSGRVYFINPETLTNEKTITVKRDTSIDVFFKDMDFYGDKIYVIEQQIIWSENTTKYNVLVYDVKTKELEETIPLTIPAEKIEAGNNKLVLATERDLYQYDLNAKEIITIQKNTREISIVLEDNILYVGSRTSGSLTKYDITENKVIDHNDDYDNGFSTTFIDGNDLYFGGYRIDKENLSSYHNSYKKFNEGWGDYLGDNIIHANDKYVFSTESVYDKYTEEKIGAFEYINNIITDSKGNYYVYSVNDGIIKKYSHLDDIGYLWKIDSKEVPTPTNINLQLNSLDHIIVTWDEVIESEGYNVYKSNSPDSDTYTKLNNEVIKDNEYIIEPLNIYAFIGYYYSVTSIHNGKESKKHYVTSDHLEKQEKLVKEMVAFGEKNNKTIAIIDPFLFGTEFNNTYEDRLYLPIKNTNVSTKVTLESNHLIDIIDRGRPEQLSRKIHIQNEKGSMAYSVGSFSKNNISDKIYSLANGELEFSIDVINDSNIKNSIEDNNIKLLSNIVEFNVAALKNGAKVELYRFDHSYVEHWIPLDKPTSYRNITGIKYDKETSTFRFMPATFVEDKDGKHWAVIKGNGTGTFAVVEAENSFSDISNHWAKEEIKLLADKLLLIGYDGKYNPERNITRAEFTTLLIRGLGLDIEKSNVETFNDVKYNDWYFDIINTAYNKELISGYDDNTFRPNKEITREEIIAITIRALEYVEGKGEVDQSVLLKYKDADSISQWAKDSAAKSVKNGIISGKSVDIFDPKSKTKRSESAVIIKRLVEKTDFIEF